MWDGGDTCRPTSRVLAEHLADPANVIYNVHYSKEPVVINGDQMPLRRNEMSSQKTMTLKCERDLCKGEIHVVESEALSLRRYLQRTAPQCQI